MSIPRNTPAAPGTAATPPRPAARPGRLRRRAVMVGNLLASSGLFFFAACSDTGIAEPRARAAPAGGPANAVYSYVYSFPTSGTSTTSGSSGTSSSVTSTSSGSGSTTTATSTSTGGDTARVTLTITPTTDATFQVNTHKVRIVPGSICDPKTSGYGPAYWNTSCTPATTTVTITAKAWTNKVGHPVVSFSPDVRFVPGKTNTIWLLDAKAAAAKADPLTWCPAGTTTCVNEAAADPSLATSYTSEGYATRRIKHFSGFTMGYGLY